MWAITPGETGATSNSHHQREEPFDGRETVQRPTHQTVVESPSRERRDGLGSMGGVVQVDQCLFSGGVVITGSGIYRGVSRPMPTYNIA